MRITLEKLCTEFRDDSWHMHGDKLGYGKVVSWMTTISEDMNTEMLSGGELLLIPKLETLGKLEKILKKCTDCLASGLISRRNNLPVNGEEILINFAQEKNFPVIIVEGESNLLQLEKSVNEYLLRMKNPEIIEEAFIGDFLFGKEKNEMLAAIEQMEGLGLNPLKAYQVALVKIIIPEANLDREGNKEQYVYQTLLKQIKKEKWQCYSMHFGRLLILLIEAENQSINCRENYELLARSMDKVKAMIPGISSKIALGRRCNQISDIKESFDEALFVLNISKMIQTPQMDNFQISYYEVGFYQLLRMVHNTEEFVRFYHDRIDVLEEYDKANGTNLLETLWIYLSNDCNMNQTSQKMFVHMNTLRYRFNKIEELTQLKLKNMNQLLELYICFHIKNYMGISMDEEA